MYDASRERQDRPSAKGLGKRVHFQLGAQNISKAGEEIARFLFTR